MSADATTGRPAPSRPALGALRLVLNFIAPYRWMAVGAGISLVVAAAAVLGIGQAIRRVIDVGFGMGNGSYLDLYFSVLFGVVAVLAIATFGRLDRTSTRLKSSQ